MTNENNNGGNGGNGGENNGNGNRRGSFTTNTFSAIFGRSSSVNQGTPATPNAPPSIPHASSSMSSSSSRPARRMSITTLGLNAAGTSPISSSAPFFPPNTGGRDRRASVSTASADSTSIDESAIEDDDAVGASAAQTAQSVPTTPFARRMSFGANAVFGGRGGPSPGIAPPSVQSRSVSGSTLFPIPARQQTHHESSLSPSSAFLHKHRTASLSKPALGPSGLSQGLGAAGARRTSISSTASSATITPPTFTGGHSTAGGISGSLGRSGSGKKSRTLSDLPGSSGGDGLNWSEQFRSRAESTATRPAHHRASFGASSFSNTSPNAEARPMTIGGQGQSAMHQRAASISDMSEPPKEMPQPKQDAAKKTSWLKGSGQKPDEVGERILRGEFLMD